MEYSLDIDKEIALATSGCNWIWDHTILGQPASKSNRRRVVQIGNQTRSIKSKEAMAYVETFKAQCFDKVNLISGDVALLVDVYYQSRRSDLACIDLIMDCLQDVAYKNDRQVKAQACNWNLDPKNPRARIRVASLASYGDTSTGVTVWF